MLDATKRVERYVPKRATHKVVITEVERHGIYNAHYNGEIIVMSSTTPLLAACKALRKRGLPLNDLVEMYRAGDAEWSLRTRLGRGAQLRVGRTNSGGLYFVIDHDQGRIRK